MLDKRIEAHQRVIEAAMPMRTMVVLENQIPSKDLKRAPYFFRDQQTFEDWFGSFTLLVSQSSTWLTTEVTRELNFAQDYLVNLHEFLKGVDSARYYAIGAVIRQDFLSLSASIERLAFDYFAADLGAFRLNDLRQHHKYALEETMKRLEQTEFRTRYQELVAIARKAG